MTTLYDIPYVAQQIDDANFTKIKLLHKVLFAGEPHKRSRIEVRKFSHYSFDPHSDEYQSRLNQHTLDDLNQIASILGLLDRTKEDLVKAIPEALSNLEKLRESLEMEEEEEEEEFDNEQADEDKETEEQVNTENEIIFPTKPAVINLRELDDFIREFDGSGAYSITKWIQDLEDEAQMQKLSELQTFTLARRRLAGLAKTFYENSRGPKSWKQLKSVLIKQFLPRLDLIEIHRQLASRKLQKNEEICNYFVDMKNIASGGKIPDGLLIDYIIRGIDDPYAKLFFAEAKALSELQEKLNTYSDIMKQTRRPQHDYRSSNSSQYIPDTRPSHMKNHHAPDTRPSHNKTYVPDNRPNHYKTQKPPQAPKNEHQLLPRKDEHPRPTRCLNCGNPSHSTINCPSKDPKCFKCNEYGHKSFQCARQGKMQKINTSSIKKVVYIADKRMEALIDTGSSITAINETAYSLIKKPTLSQPDLTLTGLGKTKVSPLGYFNSSIKIDNNIFKAKVYVLPNNSINELAIIGSDLLSQAEVNINEGKVKMKKINPITEEMQLMNIQQDTDELNMGPTLSEKSKKKVEEIITNYFPEKTQTNDIKMKIIVKDDEPIFYSPRRLPFVEKDIVDNQVEVWIKDGIIEPCTSEYASQVIVTKKKCGSPRVCIDFRKINRKIVKDRYPLPLIEDVLDKLQSARVFSTLDLRNGFFHVPVEEDSKKYTAFVTHRGHYQFLRVPFGLCNSPAVFQRYINKIFQDLTRKDIVLPYMDDLIIPSKDEESGISRLQEVLQRAKEYGLELNIKKCQFICKEVLFLGHHIENGQLRPSNLKTKAVQSFSEPKNVKHIQKFLGLTGYFRKFIPFYSIIARPLSDLLKKDHKFKFGDSEKTAFNQLKAILSEQPVLNIYRQQGDIELHTDASQFGFGAILFQRAQEDNQLHPVYYISRKTSEAEKKYSSYELEVLAVVHALQKLRIYLLGHHFKIITDCSAFQMTMNKKDLCTRIARWALQLEDYDYTIEHRPGHRMQHVDALSRLPVMIIADSITTKIQTAQEQDEHIQAIKKILRNNPHEDYILNNDILYKQSNQQDLLVIPDKLQNEIIKNSHENGHFAVKKTEEIIVRDYYIPKLKEKIEGVIRNCIPCILSNRKRGKQEGFLHPLTKESEPLHTYHIDHVGPLEGTSKNYKHILVIIDSFTKFIWLYPTKSTTSNEVIQKLEIQRKTFGSPVNIISDRGTAFTSNEFENYCQEHNIQHFKITAGLPRANGQVERINSTVIPVLTKLSINDPTRWFKHVDEVQRALNSTYQRSIDTTPFELLTGTKMKTKTDLAIKDAIDKENLKQYQEDRNDIRNKAKQQIGKIQEENRKTYNLRRKTPKRYQINDRIAIKRTQYGPGLKLKPKFLGPYRVTKAKPNDTYDVQKEDFCEGPMTTSTCAEYMKPWSSNLED